MIEALRELRRDVPYQPLTLEIYDAAVTRGQSMRELRSALKDLGAGLVYDDFGAGRARLLDLVEVPPDDLKFDICLMRDHTAGKQRQQMMETLVKMVVDLGIDSLAEGVECAGEHQTCVQIGFRFAQGYYYGRPLPRRTTLDSQAAKPGRHSSPEAQNQENR